MEMLLELMGDDISNVKILPAKRAITIQADSPTATGSLQLIRDADEFYAVTAYGRHERRDFSITLDGSYYPRLLRFLFDEFYQGRRTISLKSTLHAIELLEQAEQAVAGY
jgi:hypothetical protein